MPTVTPTNINYQSNAIVYSMYSDIVNVYTVKMLFMYTCMANYIVMVMCGNGRRRGCCHTVAEHDDM